MVHTSTFYILLALHVYVSACPRFLMPYKNCVCCCMWPWLWVFTLVFWETMCRHRINLTTELQYVFIFLFSSIELAITVYRYSCMGVIYGLSITLVLSKILYDLGIIGHNNISFYLCKVMKNIYCYYFACIVIIKIAKMTINMKNVTMCNNLVVEYKLCNCNIKVVSR